MSIPPISSRETNEEKCWLQVIAVLIGSIASITDGLLISWPSPFILKVTQDKVNYNITEYEASFFAVLPSVSMMVSCCFFTFIADKIGRKSTLLMTALPQIGSWLLKIFARNLWTFYLARIFVGIGSGCIFAAFPIYIGEISSPKVRGLTGSFVTSINFFGQFLMNVLGNIFSLPTVSYICLPLPVIFLVLFYFMPESPTYYLSKSDVDGARRSLKVLTRKEDVEEDLVKLKKDVARQLSERATWKDLFLIESNRRALIAGTILRFAQSFAGIPVFVTSMQFIFDKSDGLLTPALATMISTFTSFVTYIIAGLFVDKFGKRKSFMSSMLVSGLILIVIATYFYIEEYVDLDLSYVNWIPFVALEFCIISGSIGPGIIPTLMCGELFSTSVKAKATTVMTNIMGLAIFATINIFFQLYTITGLCGPFYLYGACSLISIIMAYFFVPETKGKTLEDIQQDLKRGKFR